MGSMLALAASVLAWSPAESRAAERAIEDRAPIVEPSFGTWPASLTERGLPRADIERYESAFAAQAKGRWDDADAALSGVTDRLLVGHVLGERYLSKRYKASWDELVAWLELYADHPQAERLFALALKRRPADAPPPPPPLRPGVVAVAGDIGDALALLKDPTEPDTRRATSAGKASSWRKKVAALAKDGQFAEAQAMLAPSATPDSVSTLDRDLAAGAVARAMLQNGKPREALRLLYNAAQRSAVAEPSLAWTAGLAAWRSGEYAIAARKFSIVANHKQVDDERRAAAAFWTARAFLSAGKPQFVGLYLRQAANSDDPFYGMLARAVLGQSTSEVPGGAGRRIAAIAALQADASGRRALALGQVGETELALTEVRTAASHADQRLATALAWLARELDGDDGDGEGEAIELRRGAAGVFYPLPRWQPKQGYRIDRALVYAVVHTESSFDARARSRAGAVGLMQVLPETAQLMARVHKKSPPSVSELFHPEVNIRYGQDYLRWLMRQPKIGDSLVLMLASYNAGPQRIIAWVDDFDIDDDPLAFIETIPITETRDYVKRVLTAYWIYEARLERTSPSLQALAQNDWPRYVEPAPASKKKSRKKADAGT